MTATAIISRNEKSFRNASRTSLLAGLVVVLTALSLTFSAMPAHARQTSVTLGPKTCTGSNSLYSTSNATYSVVHKVVTTQGAVALRTFTNLTDNYVTHRYYTGMKGSVVYNGKSFVALSGTYFPDSTVGTASLNCDY